MGNELTRRSFVAGAAAVGAVTVLPSGLIACGGESDPKVAGPTDKAWDSLEKSIRGNVLRPGGFGYKKAAAPRNRRYENVHPTGIAMCEDPEDVSKAVLWARENEIALVPRSGGHNYAGYSTTTGLQIDVTRMNSVRYLPSAGAVQAGAGAQNFQMFDGLKPHNVMVPGGQCATVGVAGLTLGGGLGFSVRRFGTTSDNLIETDVVTADGKIITCSSSQNSELFWGLRGGAGGNFGINTSFRYESHPADDAVVFELEWNGKDAEKIVPAWFEMLAKAPNTLSGILWFYPVPEKPGTFFVGTVGQLYGSEEEARDIFAPMERAAKPSSYEFYPGTYWQATKRLGKSSDTPTAYQDRSRYIAEPFSSDGLDVLIAQVKKFPALPNTEADISVFAWGGAVGSESPTETAFVHRDPIALIKYSGVWLPSKATKDARERTLAWNNETFEAMEPYSTRSSFQNFPDPELDDWQSAYYGKNFDRLVKLKAQVDPDNVFHYPQSIPVSA